MTAIRGYKGGGGMEFPKSHQPPPLPHKKRTVPYVISYVPNLRPFEPTGI